MKIDSVYLCDKATVREGLLHALGLGLQVLYRDRLPAAMAVDLVVVLTGEASSLQGSHELDVTVKSADGKMTLGRARLGWDDAEAVMIDEALPSILPLVVPLGSVGVPAHGKYSINVRLDSKAARRLDFLVQPLPSDRPQKTRRSTRVD